LISTIGSSGGQAAGTATQAAGISSDAANVTVRNGIVRGFLNGINLSGRGAVVEDMLVDQNTTRGIFVGLSGQAAIVRRNQVVDTGGSSASANVAATGIHVAGPGSLIEDNLVSSLEATGDSFERGIIIEGPNSLVRNNFVTDAVKPTGGSRGIDATGGANINILGNTASNMKTCIGYFTASGLYAGNTVAGCDTNFSGGTAGQQGNNF
jgi:hypothetical protein